MIPHTRIKKYEQIHSRFKWAWSSKSIVIFYPGYHCLFLSHHLKRLKHSLFKWMQFHMLCCIVFQRWVLICVEGWRKWHIELTGKACLITCQWETQCEHRKSSESENRRKQTGSMRRSSRKLNTWSGRSCSVRML